MPATHAAESTNDSASRPSSTAGSTNASATPASMGTPRSSADPTPQTAAFACPIRSRPTMAGSAPNAAPSKKTNAAWAQKPATRAWTAVSEPSQCARGTDAIDTAAARSATTMTRRRSSRSARAPDTSPSSR